MFSSTQLRSTHAIALATTSAKAARRFVQLVLFGLLAFTIVPSAAAEDHPELAGLIEKGADALLAELDKRHSPFDDQTMSVRMTLEGGPNDGNILEFDTITKGENLRAIRFAAPAEMKGMGVVIKGKDEIYVRLPDSSKVRRVGSHARRQSFQGTTWDFDSMAMIGLDEDFAAKITGETDTHIQMELNLDSGVDLQYTKLEIAVDREIMMIDEIKYFDDAGKLLKVQTRRKPDKMGGDHVLYTEVEMKDATTGASTVTKVLDEKVDTNVSDSTFSRRWLVRGL